MATTVTRTHLHVMLYVPCLSCWMLNLVVYKITTEFCCVQQTLQFHPGEFRSIQTFALWGWHVLLSMCVSTMYMNTCILSTAFWIQQTKSDIHFKTLHKGQNTLLQLHLSPMTVTKRFKQNVWTITWPTYDSCVLCWRLHKPFAPVQTPKHWDKCKAYTCLSVKQHISLIFFLSDTPIRLNSAHTIWPKFTVHKFIQPITDIAASFNTPHKRLYLPVLTPRCRVHLE